MRRGASGRPRPSRARPRAATLRCVRPRASGVPREWCHPAIQSWCGAPASALQRRGRRRAARRTFARWHRAVPPTQPTLSWSSVRRTPAFAQIVPPRGEPASRARRWHPRAGEPRSTARWRVRPAPRAPPSLRPCGWTAPASPREHRTAGAGRDSAGRRPRADRIRSWRSTAWPLPAARPASAAPPRQYGARRRSARVCGRCARPRRQPRQSAGRSRPSTSPAGAVHPATTASPTPRRRCANRPRKAPRARDRPPRADSRHARAAP